MALNVLQAAPQQQMNRLLVAPLGGQRLRIGEQRARGLLGGAPGGDVLFRRRLGIARGAGTDQRADDELEDDGRADDHA
ncbi:MAG: hypothetical protein IH998_11570, partial [Proteobacteria bacterium]|nr:hypothetical protein [Pseudomonadota bacterium]